MFSAGQLWLELANVANLHRPKVLRSHRNTPSKAVLSHIPACRQVGYICLVFPKCRSARISVLIYKIKIISRYQRD